MTKRPLRIFLVILGFGALILFLLAIRASSDLPARQLRLGATGWPEQAASVIAQNQAKGLWHAFGMAAFILSFCWLWTKFASRVSARGRFILSFIPVLLVAADGWLLSRHYILEMPRSYIEDNAVTEYLRSAAPHERIAIVTQQSIYGIWTTYLFPYKGFHITNVPSMPRMPDDYKALFDALGTDPLRMWRLWGAKHLIGPMELVRQLPPDLYRPVMRFDFTQTHEGELAVIPSPNGSQAIFASTEPSQRFVLIGGAEHVRNDSLLQRLADPSWHPFDTVLVSADDEMPDLDGRGIVGEVDIEAYRPGHVRVRTKAVSSAILRFAERYDPAWKATIDGDEVDIFPVDFICQGLLIPSGLHTVELRHAPSNSLIYLQATGYLLFLAAVALSMAQACRRQRPLPTIADR